MTEHAPVRGLPAEDNPGDARLVEMLLSETGFVVSHTDTLVGALEELASSMARNAVLFGTRDKDVRAPDRSGAAKIAEDARNA